MLKLSKKHWLGTALLSANVAAVSFPFMAQADTQNTNSQVNLTINPVLISYSSGPTVTLGAITPDSIGKQSAASDTVSANTNDTSGLTITMQENSASSTSMSSGSNNITASSSTPASPSTLTNGTWGWHIDSLAGFTGTGASLSNAAPSTVTYAGIPANGSPYTINTTATNGTASSTVWYSARVNNTQAIGTYSSTVLYTYSTN